jgi:hypothetical protein
MHAFWLFHIMKIIAENGATSTFWLLFVLLMFCLERYRHLRVNGTQCNIMGYHVKVNLWNKSQSTAGTATPDAALQVNSGVITNGSVCAFTRWQVWLLTDIIFSEGRESQHAALRKTAVGNEWENWKQRISEREDPVSTAALATRDIPYYLSWI